MAKTLLLDPEGVIQQLHTRYRNRRRRWLAGESDWPQRVPLGVPTEQQALDNISRVRAWIDAWANWQGPGEVSWTERRWSSLGSQTVPEAIAFPSPEAIAECVGQMETWGRARQRYQEVGEIFPQLSRVLPQHFDVLAQWNDAEFERLVQLIRWLTSNPQSGMYLRQVPVPGVHSKWIETRKKVVLAWLQAALGMDGADFHTVTGLRRIPTRLRLRLLDPDLRAAVGGVGDLQAPVQDIARLHLPIRRVFIVENLQSGLAFDEIEGAVVFMGQGYAVEPFAEIPWLKMAACYYWGDIDTHGLAILDSLRQHLPNVHSLLMDAETLLDHRDLWGHEDKQVTANALPGLYTEESKLFADLKANRWGTRVRLEQERIPWAYAARRILRTGQEGENL